MLRQDLSPSDYDPYYEQYISLATGENAIAEQESQIAGFRAVFDSVSESDAEKLHAPYTWTLKQVVDHLNNNEKIFGCRALRFSVGDQTELVGYNQDTFAANASIQNCSLQQLTDELEHSRRSNLLMFKRLSSEAWERAGTADGNKLSVRAIAFLQIGHLEHHLQIVKNRLA